MEEGAADDDAEGVAVGRFRFGGHFLLQLLWCGASRRVVRQVVWDRILLLNGLLSTKKSARVRVLVV